MVISGPTPEGHHDVYTISIREVFKGLPQGAQERAFGVLDHALTAKLYTPSRQVSSHLAGPFGIKRGTEYFIYGVIIQGGKLFTSFSYLREAWNKVTQRQKANLRGYYEAGCRQCRMKPGNCTAESDARCEEKLPGCEKKAQELYYSFKAFCWRKFEHCEVDETGQRCHWKENNDSRNCKKNPSRWIHW